MTMISSLKTVKIGYSCQLKRTARPFQNLLLQILEISCLQFFPEHFICYATEKNLTIESAEFQHKSANKFSQKKVDSIKLETIF